MIRFEASSSALFFAIISSGSQSSGINPDTFGRSDPRLKNSYSSSVMIPLSRKYLKVPKSGRLLSKVLPLSKCSFICSRYSFQQAIAFSSPNELSQKTHRA